MTSIDEFRAEFHAWTQANFPTQTAEQAGLALAEEAGELCRAILKRAQGIRGTSGEWEAEVAKEIGDVFMALQWIANRFNLDLDEVVLDRWKTIKKRDWLADPIGHGIPT